MAFHDQRAVELVVDRLMDLNHADFIHLAAAIRAEAPSLQHIADGYLAAAMSAAVTKFHVQLSEGEV